MAISGLSSCEEPPTQAEKVYLDTLYFKIRGDEKALNIDEQALVQRKMIIREKWLPSVADTVPDIRMRIEDDLRGMLTAYDFYLDRYLLLQSSNRLLMEEWEAFKAQTDAEEISREDFKARYRDLNEKVTKNSADIAFIAKPVYDLEPMWLRYERMMTLRGVETE
ncbi:MAG: hypothetical protein LPK45_06215 [Bacteroidota bacterium]|nr:hypothetical protein [Bacteroidota bacterium]MDX5430667.1 hypothetical protein [Bacteroidota bacterium]MDX5469414.1 hypothetical protein [Bacteroidota bacterium]